MITTRPSSFVFFGGMTLLFLFATALAASTNTWQWMLVPFAALLTLTAWSFRTAVFFLLLISLPFSFEYQVSPTLGTDIPDEPLMLLTSFLFIAYWIYQPAVLKRTLLFHPLVLLLCITIGWSLLATVCSSNHLVSIKYLLAKSWYIGAFVLAPFFAWTTTHSVVASFRWLVISLAVVTTIILVRQSINGFEFATVNEAVTPFFRNHVTYSAMVVCLLPVSVAFFYIDDPRFRKWWRAVIFLFLIAIVFAYARGAWLALCMCMVAYGLLRKRLLLFSFVLLSLLLAGIFIYLKKDDRYLAYAPHYQTTIFHKQFREHLISTYRLNDVSTAERFYRWAAGIRMIEDQPLLGTGPSTFYEQYRSYEVPLYRTWVSNNPDHSTVHNYFLLIAIEQGLPGLLFFLLLCGAMLAYAERIYHRASNKQQRAIAAAIALSLVALLTVNFWSDLIETDKNGSLFFLSLAALIILDLHQKKSKPAAHL